MTLSLSTCLLRGLAIGTLIVVLMLYGCTPVLAADQFGPQTNVCQVVTSVEPKSSQDELPDWGSREDLALKRVVVAAPGTPFQHIPTGQCARELPAKRSGSGEIAPVSEHADRHESRDRSVPAGVAPGPLRHFQPDPAPMWRLFSYELATLCLVALAGQFHCKH